LKTLQVKANVDRQIMLIAARNVYKYKMQQRSRSYNHIVNHFRSKAIQSSWLIQNFICRL
jgi:hypothetical protein